VRVRLLFLLLIRQNCTEGEAKDHGWGLTVGDGRGYRKNRTRRRYVRPASGSCRPGGTKARHEHPQLGSAVGAKIATTGRSAPGGAG